MGQWLAAAGPADDPLALGVMSVPPRRIPPISGVLGITMKTDEKAPATIDKVQPNSPAAKAGMKDGDVITHVNGKEIENSVELIKMVRQFRPGDNVRLNVKRGSSILAIPAKLGTLDSPGAQKQEMQNRMGVGISRRHDDFPTVLQHDTVVRPTDCGGPMVDLSGKVIGVNIARGGRTETYCVPTEVLMGMMYELMSGRMAPPDAAKLAAEKKAAEEKAAADKAAAEKVAAEKAAAEKKDLETKLAAEKTAREKAEQEKKAADDRANAEKAARDKIETEKKAADERAAAEKANAEKLAADKAAADQRANAEKANADRITGEKAAAEKRANDEKTARDNADKEKLAADQRAAAEKANAEKLAAEKAAAEQRANQEKMAREKLEAEKKALEEQLAKERAEREKK